MTDDQEFRDFSHRQLGETGPMNPPVKGIPLMTHGFPDATPQKMGGMLCKVARKSGASKGGKSHTGKASSKGSAIVSKK